MKDTELDSTHPVLLIDDEQESLDSVEITLKSNGIHKVLRCQDSREVLPLLQKQPVEVILMDLGMPHMTGEELLPLLRRDYPEIPVIVVTGLAELEKAVLCMRAGAFDYMVKPVEPSRLVSSVKRAMETRSLARENSLLRDRLLSPDLQNPDAFAAIVTSNPMMQTIFKYVEAIAASPHCVTVTGETGVGKELIVRAIHKLSGRKGDLVCVNVAGLDDHMFSDTLFGHERGAFTGAEKVRGGLIEKADKGTLFLDEIGDLSPSSQAKLLRLLQEKEYFRLGSDEPRLTNARIIVATHHDLATLQEQGKYRRDLFYRLMTHHVQLPPLRDRLATDLPELIRHFLTKAAKELGKNCPRTPPEIITLLRTYHFPGNVRELEGLIFDAVSRHTSRTLSLESIREHIQQRRDNSATSANVVVPPVVFSRPLPTIRETTRMLIEEALKESGGNQAVAAQLLGITPQALGQRLKRAELTGDQL